MIIRLDTGMYDYEQQLYKLTSAENTVHMLLSQTSTGGKLTLC
jgi:hypothetical protein